jgi:ABC-type antimicrobial peptide transport system permease subunit
MKTNVPLISSLRKPFSSLLLLLLFGLISFGFITKAIGFILVRRETGVLGSYYRSIGFLENTFNPQSGDISAGIRLIETSPYYAYGDQREIVSGVMSGTYNTNIFDSNTTDVVNYYSNLGWPLPNTHNTHIWFTGELIKKEEIKTKAEQPENQKTIADYLVFDIDTLLAGYPEYAKEGGSVGLLFVFDTNEAAIPIIQEMVVGQRYFIHGWYDGLLDPIFYNYSNLQIIPLDEGGQYWYLPLAKDASIDFSTPNMSVVKNEIDVLNENLHTLSIIATADMSAMPQMQESSRNFYLVEGRWLNRQDDLDKDKVIVVPEDFTMKRRLKLGDEIQLTFRPLTDTFLGHIRDGIDSASWKSYPTYQDTFKIVGIYNATSYSAGLSFIPTSSLRPGFTSSTQNIFKYMPDYNFVLDSSRHETQFTQAYKAPLQSLGINLTFLPNNGPAYWAAVDPIRRSASADVLVFGLLMVVALSMAVFIYQIQRRRDYAILRALGVPAKHANQQIILPLLLLGGLGILVGGLPSWNYALSQAKASISTIPTPAGVTPSAALSTFFLAGLCLAMFLLLALFSWLGVLLLARKPVLEILQGQTYRAKGTQKLRGTGAITKPIPPIVSSLAGDADTYGRALQEPSVNKAILTIQRTYHPSSLSQYVSHHLLRSRLKSFLTLAIALGFMLASGWIRQTMERSRTEVDRLYDTTIVQADIILADPASVSTEETPYKGSGFIYQKTIESVLKSGFVISSSLEADITWPEIGNFDTPETIVGFFPVYAYDSPEAFYFGLADPSSLSFAPGWDMERFARPLTMEEVQQEGVPALFPAILLEQLQLKVGEKVRIIDPYTNIFPCIIVGQYSGGRSFIVRGGKIPWLRSSVNSILISLSSLESIEGSHTKFTVAHFTLDPTKNRELPQFREEMAKVMQTSGAGSHDLRFMIWDEELKVVVAQLEKNISLLKVLYPVVMAVSVLIGAGLCFLLLLQNAKEAAILRVLGTTQTSVRLTLIVEPLILTMVGVIIGLGIAWLVWRPEGLATAGPLLISAALYLAGVLVGLMLGAISVTNKKPIELLQVKE